MASESLIGGDVYDSLSPETQGLLDAVLGDTVNGVVTTTPLQGGGVLVVGTGSGGVQQGAVIATSGTAVTAELDSGGNLTLSVTLPSGVAMAFEGPSGALPPEQANDYIKSIINAALPADSTDLGVQEARTNLITAIDALTQTLGANSTAPLSVDVHVVAFDPNNSQGSAPQNVVFHGSPTPPGEAQMVAFLMGGLGGNTTLVLDDVPAAFLVGGGTVQVSGATPSIISADGSSQTIFGGAGNDTIIGGGGNDTVVGGAGFNIFGVGGLGGLFGGSLTISDFDVTRDHLAFFAEGLNTLEAVAGQFTGLTETGNGVVLHLNGLDITLVGVSLSSLSLDLLKFDL